MSKSKVEVGNRVQVLWNDGLWYDGVVTAVNTARYTVLYPGHTELSRHAKKRWPADPGIRLKSVISGGNYDRYHKNRCRDYLYYTVASQKRLPRRSALVLDDQNLMATKMLHDVGDWDVVTPNYDRDIVTVMAAEGISTPFHGNIGQVIAARETSYDFVWLDYCGQPGKPSKPFTPMWDIAQLFICKRLKPGSILAVTVCARNNTKFKKGDPKHLNLCRTVQQIYSCADKERRLVEELRRFIYKDKGSQTMCFICFRVR